MGKRKIGNFVKESNILGHTGKEAKKLTVKLWGKGVICKKTIFNGSENTQYYVRRAGQLIYGKLDFLNCAFGIIPPELDGYESTLDSPAFDIHDILAEFLLHYIIRKEFYKKNGDKANGSRKVREYIQRYSLKCRLWFLRFLNNKKSLIFYPQLTQ